MRHAPSTMLFLNAFKPLAPIGAIEWEELPSLASAVSRRVGQVARGPWDATRPATLEEVHAPSQPFREPWKGVAVREVTEPDVFRHFFGA